MSEGAPSSPLENVPAYPSRERVHAPLAAAVVALEGYVEPLPPSLEDLVHRAKLALDHLTAICPPRAEVVERYLAGPFERRLDAAQAEGERAGRYRLSTISSGMAKAIGEVESLFHSVADTPVKAQSAFSRFMTEVAALRAVFTEAQADGWQRGDQRSEATLAARATVHLVVRRCATLLD